MATQGSGEPSKPSSGRPRKREMVGAMSVMLVACFSVPDDRPSLTIRNGRVSSGPRPPCWPQPIGTGLPSFTIQRRPGTP